MRTGSPLGTPVRASSFLAFAHLSKHLPGEQESWQEGGLTAKDSSWQPRGRLRGMLESIPNRGVMPGDQALLTLYTDHAWLEGQQPAGMLSNDRGHRCIGNRNYCER